MVKTRQKRITVFEFQEGTTQEILFYIRQNKDVLQTYCLAFHEKFDKEIESLLQELGINYFFIRNAKRFKTLQTQKVDKHLDSLKSVVIQGVTQSHKTASLVVDSNKEKCIIQHRESSLIQDNINADIADNDVLSDVDFCDLQSKLLPCKIFKRTIRSGEELVLHSHNVFLKGVNAGAFIKSHGNLEIYGKCEGNLECFGNYIIIRHFFMGRISLQGINLERKMLDDLRKDNEVKMIFTENGKIQIMLLAQT
ncbi:hypothetical protein [Helicobacter sp. MIT 14-3879]|uniref:hypothetical protein n=1 Tax=Helicobacter sp. MIT 14-3879 TaxID=2040649 RepID=UPI000E1E8912|nr:hypothetical protein [Helicobacter sp. MIT 14-3879]RDU61555.1 hypothetical protein CQA44_08530 [Helicobacter sp. MIT 14-3879]